MIQIDCCGSTYLLTMLIGFCVDEVVGRDLACECLSCKGIGKATAATARAMACGQRQSVAVRGPANPRQPRRNSSRGIGCFDVLTCEKHFATLLPSCKYVVVCLSCLSIFFVDKISPIRPRIAKAVECSCWSEFRLLAHSRMIKANSQSNACGLFLCFAQTLCSLLFRCCPCIWLTLTFFESCALA